MNESFHDAIVKFNQMYDLESADSPQLLPKDRLQAFHNILAEELEEVQDIKAQFKDNLSPEEKLKILTDLSDWLGDIVVYCASEARRWGLPLREILEIIMASNFSKLGADHKAIKDPRGKVMKGPNYWKPEPKIESLLQDKL